LTALSALLAMTILSALLMVRKLDIVDSVMKKLEKFAENLELSVCLRTAELEQEKQKTDQLLYRMLPQ
jgi:C4-dicarboxylate-specific signal transduction histidine kinase